MLEKTFIRFRSSSRSRLILDIIIGHYILLLLRFHHQGLIHVSLTRFRPRIVRKNFHFSSIFFSTLINLRLSQCIWSGDECKLFPESIAWWKTRSHLILGNSSNMLGENETQARETMRIQGNRQLWNDLYSWRLKLHFFASALFWPLRLAHFTSLCCLRA